MKYELMMAMVVAAVQAVSGGSIRGLKVDSIVEIPSTQLTPAAQEQRLLLQAQPMSDEDLARKFAPQLRFDRKAETFPQRPEWYWNTSHTDKNGDRKMNGTVASSWPHDASTMATTYNVERCNTGRVVIEYWFIYSYQNPCFEFIFSAGSHNGDWERVVVGLNKEMTQVDRVTFHRKSLQQKPRLLSTRGRHAPCCLRWQEEPRKLPRQRRERHVVLVL